MTFISYAQNFEDVMLWRALKHVENGFYIDIGAQDPVVDSVSLAFYEHGWRGVHVEPVLDYVNQLVTARPDETVIPAAVGSDGGLLTFFTFPDTGLSTADPLIAQRHKNNGFQCAETKVPVVSLDEILNANSNHPVHWLKLDVEGAEKDVLKSWKKSNVRPWILVIESTCPLTQEQSYQEWEQLVLSHGYVFVYFDGLNRYYISAEHLELKPAFAMGANIFDDFKISPESGFYTKNNNDDFTKKTQPESQLYKFVTRLEKISEEISERDTRIESLKQKMCECNARIKQLLAELMERDVNIKTLARNLHKHDNNTREFLQTITELSEQVQSGKHEAHRWWLAHEKLRAQLDSIERSHSFKLVQLLVAICTFPTTITRKIKDSVRSVVLSAIKKVLTTPFLRRMVKPVVSKLPFVYKRLYFMAMSEKLFDTLNVTTQLMSFNDNGQKHPVIHLDKKAKRVLEDLQQARHRNP